jgi:hypothetical protein
MGRKMKTEGEVESGAVEAAEVKAYCPTCGRVMPKPKAFTPEEKVAAQKRLQNAERRALLLKSQLGLLKVPQTAMPDVGNAVDDQIAGDLLG